MDPARQIRASSELVYEDLEPKMEWEREPAADTLSIFLPGFRKEQLKVQVTASRFLRVSGERLLNDNKWVRFKKEIPIASNYDTNEISAKFERGILHVKHPKIIVQDPEPLQEKPAQQPASSEAPKPKPEKTAQPPKEAPKTQQKPLPPVKPSQEEVQQPPVPKPPVPKPPQKSPAKPMEQSKPAPESVPENSSWQGKRKQEIASSKPERPTGEMQVREASKAGINGQKSGRNNGRGDSSNVLQKLMETENELGKTEQKDESKGIMTGTEAGKPVAATDARSTKQENLNRNDSVKDGREAGRDKEIADREEPHKQAFGGLGTTLKNPREFMACIVAALQIMVIGLYVMIMKAIKSIRKSAN